MSELAGGAYAVAVDANVDVILAHVNPGRRSLFIQNVGANAINILFATSQVGVYVTPGGWMKITRQDDGYTGVVFLQHSANASTVNVVEFS
jgi:hypothetical protein